jgi:DNA-binding SARP family transcriptional activator
VVEDGQQLTLGGKLLRAFVATLLVHARELRTTDQFIDDVWGERAPANARASLQNMVAHLRRVFTRNLLETTRTGYVLVVDEYAVDATRFERLLTAARGARCDAKVGVLEQAIALWRGSPLIDVRYEEFAQSEIRRLEELRVSAQEELLAAKLELGASEAVIPELQRLLASFPHREQLRMQLMVALHRSGRSVEAISTYIDWRRTLIDSWNIEPGRAIERLCADIRRRAPELEIVSSYRSS